MVGNSEKEVKLKEYRYTGKERDDATGLYYYGVRYYCPWIGRWLSADPAGPVDGLNLYEYVRGNPVGLVDPDGCAVKNEDGSITFDSENDWLSKYSSAAGYSDWREAKEQFVKDYPEAVSWWDDKGNWTGTKQDTLIGKTLRAANSVDFCDLIGVFQIEAENAKYETAIINNREPNEIEKSGRSMLWSGVKDVGYGTAQVTFGALLLSSALAQSAVPSGVTQVTGAVTGAAGAWYLVGGVGSLGLGAGKIIQGLQNRNKKDNLPSLPPILDMLFTPGYPQATEDLIRGRYNNEKK